MKKMLIFCLLSLVILNSIVFAESNANQNTAKKLKFCPKPFLNATFAYFWHKRDGFGVNILGFDLALLKYRAFYFLNFGVGIAGFWEEKSKWMQYGYYAWEICPDGVLRRVFYVTGEGWGNYKDPYITPYFKFSPVKVPMNITKNMRDKVFFELGIFSRNLKRIDGFEIGLSFSFNVFERTKKEKGEEE